MSEYYAYGFDHGLELTEVLSEQIKNTKIPICAISGPNLATEIINLIRSIAEADECIKIIKERK